MTENGAKRGKRDRRRDISGVHHMPARQKTYRLTLTPATEAALLRLKECGENKQLLSRCALWCSSDALEALIVLQKKRFPYQVGQYVCVSRLAGGERKGGTSSQEHHSWSAATTTQSAASSAGQ